MLKFALLNIIIIITLNVFSNSKIYLIRHASVQIENPGWCNTKIAHAFKEEYNKNLVEAFDPEIVLNKIENPEIINTVFCSPQYRTMQTADLLFNQEVKLNTNKNLMELNYTQIQFPILKLPVRVWQAISLIYWMAGNNRCNNPTYKQRKQDLEIYSNEIITFAEENGKCVVIGHAMMNRELMKILRKKGWKLEQNDGYGNLSVNCLVKSVGL